MEKCSLCAKPEVYKRGLCFVCNAKCLAMPTEIVTLFGQNVATRKEGPVTIETYDYNAVMTEPVVLNRLRVYYGTRFVHGETTHRIVGPPLESQ
jgi:hypothetical protein